MDTLPDKTVAHAKRLHGDAVAGCKVHARGRPEDAEGSDRSRLEANHELLWVNSEAATRILTHPSHAWAVEQWKRRS